MSNRKPHNHIAGYVCELKAFLGGHVVIYDRNAGFDFDQPDRYVVKMEPNGACIPERSMPDARATMKHLASCSTAADANAYYDGAYSVAETE